MAFCPFTTGACEAELVQANHYCKNIVELARGAGVDTADKCAQETAADTRCAGKYFYWGKHLGGHCMCAKDECADKFSDNGYDKYSIYSTKNCRGMYLVTYVLLRRL